MKSKPFLIAIAAFAVTATGVHAAAGVKMLERAGLSEEQISALEVARELREAGEYTHARDILVEAGVDEAMLRSVYKVMHENREAIHQAIEEKNYQLFREATEGTPLADVIDSEVEFLRFIEAHDLKADGKWKEAKDIFSELGLEREMRHFGMGRHGGMKMSHHFQALSEEQREALKVAKMANDKEAVRAILEEVGVDMPRRQKGGW